jgi:hypothetical protein
MGTDEIGTLTMLKAHRRELVDPTIAANHGRIVKTTGDGMLAEFASVVDAVTCAITVQRAMVSRNAGVPEAKRIIFRVGINVGDILIDGDDIPGDGVNIAARLETLCDPGGLLYLPLGERPDQGQALVRLRRSRRADRQKHIACNRDFRAQRKGDRGATPNGSTGTGKDGRRKPRAAERPGLRAEDPILHVPR